MQNENEKTTASTTSKRRKVLLGAVVLLGIVIAAVIVALTPLLAGNEETTGQSGAQLNADDAMLVQNANVADDERQSESGAENSVAGTDNVKNEGTAMLSENISAVESATDSSNIESTDGENASNASAIRTRNNDTSTTHAPNGNVSMPSASTTNAHAVPKASSSAGTASQASDAPTHEHTWKDYKALVKQGYYDSKKTGTTRSMIYVYNHSGARVNSFLPANRTDAQAWADRYGYADVREVSEENELTFWHSPVYEYGKKCSCGAKQVEGTQGGTTTTIGGHA